MRISDWSSDVCSSDLLMRKPVKQPAILTCGAIHVNGDRGFCCGAAIVTATPPAPFRVRARLRPAGPALRPSPAPRAPPRRRRSGRGPSSEEHTSELQSLMPTSYDGFCLEQKNQLPEIRQPSYST